MCIRDSGDSAQHLTTALSFAIDDLVDAVREALLDRAAMAREHQAGLQLLHLLQALEIACLLYTSRCV